MTQIAGRQYLLLTLERIGGVVIYDLSNPKAPTFVQYLNAQFLGDAGNTGGRRPRARGRPRRRREGEPEWTAAAARVERSERIAQSLRDQPAEAALIP